MSRARRARYGEVWLLSTQVDETPEDWTTPSRGPLVLRCTATIDGAAYIERITPFVKAEYPPRVAEISSIPHAVLPVRARYLKVIGFAQTPRDLGDLLAQAFDERLMKELWPDVWREWHNYYAKKERRRRESRGENVPRETSRPYKSESVRHAAPRSIY